MFYFNLLKPKIKLSNSQQQNQMNECVQVCLEGKENPNKNKNLKFFICFFETLPSKMLFVKAVH